MRRRRAPPLPVIEEAQAPGTRAALERLFDADPACFDRLFLAGERAAAPAGLEAELEALAAVGLVRRRRRAYVPQAQVFRLLGRHIATDLWRRKGLDMVFPLMFEQVYLVRNLGVEAGDRVLELCLGSGVNSLFAADVAQAVTGVDVNMRAILFASFNAILNGDVRDRERFPDALFGRLDFQLGSLFEPLSDGARFDLVFVNPPFELVPPGGRHYLHSHGGADGLDVIREILAGLPARLTPEGRFEIITWSPGGADEVALVPLLQAALPGHRLLVHHLGRVPIEDDCRPFERTRGYAAWREDLAARGLTHVHFVFVSTRPDPEPRVEGVHPEDEITHCAEIADAWHAQQRT